MKNRKARGLIALLATVLVMALAVGCKAWSAGTEAISVVLLKPSDTGFGRFGRAEPVTTNDENLRPEPTAEVLCLGLVRVVKVGWQRSPAGPPASTL